MLHLQYKDPKKPTMMLVKKVSSSSNPKESIHHIQQSLGVGC